MKIQDIDNLIKRLEGELGVAKKDSFAAERLQWLKDTAKTYKGEDRVVTFEEIYKKIDQTEEAFKIFTGWPELDILLRGFRPQQVVVLSAATKSGKTTWCMDLTARIAEHNPMWFPYEESAEELMRKYKERDLPPPHGYAPSITTDNQIDWVESKIIEAIAKYGTHIVFIDHLEFIVAEGHENYSLRVMSTMKQIKQLAKKWNICIVLMCHIKKLENIDRVPSYNDLKESSSIAQHCDTAILLWREAIVKKQDITITNNTIVSVQLNRRFGSTGNVTMSYENGAFIEKEWREEVLNAKKADEDYNDF